MNAADLVKEATMKDGLLTVDRRRPRWSLSFLMTAVAALAILFNLARPFATPAVIRAAEQLLREYTPEGRDLSRYQVEKVEQLPKAQGGNWRIRFVRVVGQGKPE